MDESIRKRPWFLERQGKNAFRHWKRDKRREADAVIKAMGELNLGSAYLPEYETYTDARDAMERVREAMRESRWGR